MTKLRNLINVGALAAAVSVALPVLADTTVVAHGGHHYVYYRDHDGRIRRAIVSPGTDRLRFSNVPSSLLSEVISRLY